MISRDCGNPDIRIIPANWFGKNPASCLGDVFEAIVDDARGTMDIQ